jgi:acyl-coenzyme A synthetase/AMP-(fatty) acid ligase
MESAVGSFPLISPGRIAVLFGDTKIDYGRFGTDIATMATWLASCGLKQGQRLAILMSHPYWQWVAYLGAVRLGLTIGLLTQNFRNEVSVGAGFDFVIGELDGIDTSTVAEHALKFSPPEMNPLSEQLGGASGDSLRGQWEDASLQAQQIIFTSGTTGSPKAVLVTSDNFRKRVAHGVSTLGFDSDTCVMMFVGMDTALGTRIPLAAWYVGGSVALMRPIPRTQDNELSSDQLGPVNFIVTPPLRLQTVLREFPYPWAKRETRRILVVGGRLPTSTRDGALRYACRTILILYGSAEAGCMAIGEGGLLDRHPGAVGYASEPGSIEIVDADGRKLPAGESGIVRVRTPYTARTYEGIISEADAAALRDGWFYPGDEGRLSEDGLLVIEGRATETLNLMGSKVSLATFEMQLSELESVQDAAALILSFANEDRLTISLVADHNDLAVFRKQISELVPRNYPFTVLKVPSIPRNAMGKVDRPTLKKNLSRAIEARMAQHGQRVAPSKR